MFFHRKTVRPNNKRTKRYLDKLPKIYLVVVWARAGVWEYPFSGYYDKVRRVPLVWDYDDRNGTCDHWFLRPITRVTTGDIKDWTSDPTYARELADIYNKTHQL